MTDLQWGGREQGRSVRRTVAWLSVDSENEDRTECLMWSGSRQFWTVSVADARVLSTGRMDICTQRLVEREASERHKSKQSGARGEARCWVGMRVQRRRRADLTGDENGSETQETKDTCAGVKRGVIGT